MASRLYRWNPSNNCTLGTIHVGDFHCHTIERPWIPDDNCLGGRPFESCVPDGTYTLLPFTRPNGDEVYQLVNEALGVYRFQEDIPEGVVARYLILIHMANWVKDIVGCIGPGKTQTYDNSGNPMVGSSRWAMERIVPRLDAQDNNELIIETLR